MGEKTHKNKSVEIQAKNALVLKAMDKVQTEIKRNVQVAEGFRQGIVEAKEKKAAAEVSMVNQDRVLSEAKTKKATQMTREAKAKHAGNTAKKLAGEAEAFTNGMVEKAEEVKSKTRVAKEAFNDLSGKAAERTSKHERAGKSSHKEEKQEKEKDKKENVQKAAETKEKEAAQKASEATYKKDQEVKKEKKETSQAIGADEVAKKDEMRAKESKMKAISRMSRGTKASAQARLLAEKMAKTLEKASKKAEKLEKVAVKKGEKVAKKSIEKSEKSRELAKTQTIKAKKQATAAKEKLSKNIDKEKDAKSLLDKAGTHKEAKQKA